MSTVYSDQGPGGSIGGMRRFRWTAAGMAAGAVEAASGWRMGLLIEDPSVIDLSGCGIVYRLIELLSREFCRLCTNSLTVMQNYPLFERKPGAGVPFVLPMSAAIFSGLTGPVASGYPA